MQKDSTSITGVHTDGWKNPASLGFSTWQRHTAINLAGANPDISPHRYGHVYSRGEDQRGLRAICDRHASFAESLIARRHQESPSSADAARFIYALPINRLKSPYPAAQYRSAPLQRKPYHGLTSSLIGGSVASPVGDGMTSRAIESRSIHTPASAAYGLPSDASLSSLGSVGGHAYPGAEPGSIPAVSPVDSGENPTPLYSSFLSSPIFQVKGGAGLSAGQGGNAMHHGNPMFGGSFLINRSLMAPSTFYGQTRLGEGVYRTHKRTSAALIGNAEAGSVLNPGLPYPVHTSIPRYVQRRSASPHIQSSGKQVLSVIPSVSIPLGSEAATIARTAAVSTLQYSGYSGASGGVGSASPYTLSSFSRPSGLMSTRAPATLAIPDRISRKVGIRNLSKAEPALQDSVNGQLSMIAARPIAGSTAGPLGTGMPRFGEKLNENFNRVDTLRASAPGSISYVLRRFTDTSSPKTSSRETPPLTVAAHAPPVRIHPTQSTQPQPIRHGEQAQGYKGPGGYEADSLPAIQRLQNKTGLFAAHRRAITPQLSIPSVHSPGEQPITQRSPLSERILQNKSVSLLPAGAGPYHYPGPRIQFSRVSSEIASSGDSWDSLLPSRISRRSMTRSGGVTEGIAGDHIGIPDGPYVLQRIESSPSWAASSHSVNDRTNRARQRSSSIPDHSVFVIAASTRSNMLSPAFLPLTRQTGITRSTDARPDVDPMRTSSSDSNSTASSVVPSPYDQVNRTLRLKPLALPHPTHPVMRQTIARSAEQQPLSISNGYDMAPQMHARHGLSFSKKQSIPPLQSTWTAGSDRPLVIPQPGLDKLMRASRQGGGALTTPDHPEDRYGLVSPPNEPIGEQIRRAGERIGEVSKTPESTLAEPDPEETAEHVWRLMAERLVIEQERRGLAKWP